MKHNHHIRILEKKTSGIDMYHFICVAPDELWHAFTQPGQFLSLQHETLLSGRSGFFALANAPRVLTQAGTKTVELLIKNSNELTEALCSLQVGDKIASSLPLGKGFLVQPYLCSTSEVFSAWHLFAMGSGLAPLRSLLQYIFASDFSITDIHLWQGALSSRALPFPEEYELWQQKGVHLHLCYDGKDQPPSVTRANVMETLAEQRPDLRKAVVCWAGSKDFGQALARLTKELGLPQTALLDNIS